MKWNYDEYGCVTNKLDQTATEILRYTYDADSRLSNRWSVAKGTTIYGYDPVGNLTNINYPASTDVRFTYDALNRASNMVDAWARRRMVMPLVPFCSFRSRCMGDFSASINTACRIRTSAAGSETF